MRRVSVSHSPSLPSRLSVRPRLPAGADHGAAAVDISSSPPRQVIPDDAEAHHQPPTTSPIILPLILNLLLPYLINNPFRPRVDATGATAAAGDRSAGCGEKSARVFAAVLVVLPYVATVMIGILAEFKNTVAGWSAAPAAAYGLAAVLAVALMMVGVTGVMAAVEGGDHAMLSASALCAKLGATLSGLLLLVSFSCKMGPWGCVAAVPSAAVIAAVLLAVWNYRAVAQAASSCRHRLDSLLPMTMRRSHD